MSIAMEIESDTDLYDWTIEVGITTLLGNMLFSTTTEMLGVALEPLRGVRRFQFRFPALPLGTGDSSVRTTIRSSSGAELHHVPVAAQFSVHTDNTSRGPVYIPSSSSRYDRSGRLSRRGARSAPF